MKACTAREGSIRYVVVRFDDRNRYGQTGVPATLLFSGGERCVVRMKEETIQKAGKRNRFGKIQMVGARGEAQLEELLGDVGDYKSELSAYQFHFGVKPCRYPKPESWELIADPWESGEPFATSLPLGAPSVSIARRLDCRHLDVFSVDNASTRDIDDALSVEWHGEVGRSAATLGIHVADVASRIGCDSTLYSWARSRGASAYHTGTGSGEPGETGGSVPMLPHELAHDVLSLNEGVERNALSLFLEVGADARTVTNRWHARTRLRNTNATSYAKFGADGATGATAARNLLRALSREYQPEDLVAYTMIEYNSYFGALVSVAADAQGSYVHEPLVAARAAGLLRVQPSADEASVYAQPLAGNSEGRAHASLGITSYAHVSSPIRRWADLHTQHAIVGSLDSSARAALDVGLLNERSLALKGYHAHTTSMELAYRCRAAPMRFAGSVEISDEGEVLRVHVEAKPLTPFSPYVTPHFPYISTVSSSQFDNQGRRVRIPLHDNFFAEPLVEALLMVGLRTEQPLELALELWGVLKSGRMQLRVRLPRESPAPTLAAVAAIGAGGVDEAAEGVEPLEQVLTLVGAMGLQEVKLAAVRESGVAPKELCNMETDDISAIFGCSAAEAKALHDAANIIEVEVATKEMVAKSMEPLLKAPHKSPHKASLKASPVALARLPPGLAVQPDVPAAPLSLPPAPPPQMPPLRGGLAAPSAAVRVNADEEEFDRELMDFLNAQKSLSTSTVRLLGRSGVGLGALGLVSEDELVDSLGCLPEEAASIVRTLRGTQDVAIADASADVPAQRSADAAGAAEAAAGASEDAMRLNAEAMVADGAALTEEEVTRTMGYPPDPFQV